MAYWLYKSEPFKWSWDHQVEAGAKGTFWNGVRNHSAKLNMIAMKKGDHGFFYHSNEGKEIVGIVEVCTLAHPDSTDLNWECVDIRALMDVPKPVTLADVKAKPELAKMSLVASMRLSVQPVTTQEWKIVCGMAGFKAKEIP